MRSQSSPFIAAPIRSRCSAAVREDNGSIGGDKKTVNPLGEAGGGTTADDFAPRRASTNL